MIDPGSVVSGIEIHKKIAWKDPETHETLREKMGSIEKKQSEAEVEHGVEH